MRCAFIADTGTGCDYQKSVAKGLSKLIKQEKIKFVLLGGDNFYPDGCAGKDDSLFTTHFETPYKSISNDIKFFGCLGNHDIHHPNGHNAQFDYSEHSIENDMKFILPNHFYDFGHKDLFQVFVIDGNLENMNEDLKSEQTKTTCKEIKKSKAIWKVLMVHTPLVSPGEHGPLMGTDEKYVKHIVRKGIDLVCSGHDHLQACINMKIGDKNVIQVINGAGAKPYFKSDKYIHPEYVSKKRGCDLLHVNTELGYCCFDFTPKKLKIDFLNIKNDILFTKNITKK